ncbi:cell division protein SepF [Metabacillus iocasae]|jgi:cell division inhibitor SepF|uniref:Cell division protein SepF n=1 Tax=Priestia iocasae TaxID=2291674 RepID=A0ABS2QS51_9BACI|nr:cell division protein SepF [Metabacillus iocasae]MBM7701787.1 cell division inhibitor SepF [Metabacillus iocasae]
MTFKNRFRSFFALDDEQEYVEEQEEAIEEEEVSTVKQSKQPQTKQQNIISLQSVQKSTKMVVYEPREYAEAQEITDHLKNRKAVVVNLQSISRDQGVRIVDFLSGTVYALGGDIQKIGVDIFLCTPDNVDVTGKISSMMTDEESINIKRW